MSKKKDVNKKGLVKIPGRPTEKGEMRYRIQFDFSYKGHPGAEVEGESITQPDMNLTVAQLLERHTRGQAVPLREPMYFETEIPTINDLTDLEEYRDQLKRRTEEVEQILKDEVDSTTGNPEGETPKEGRNNNQQPAKAEKDDKKESEKQGKTNDDI